MTVTAFLSGICMATFAASAVFFLKFWRAAHDRFFLLFAIACSLISLERVALLLIEGAHSSVRTEQTEAASWVYLIRLMAFLMILFAIINKNRSKR